GMAALLRRLPRAEVWALVTGFSGYAFNKAHSTAYGVEAYQAAWLKRWFPAEFLAAVLTNGKGFYHPLVYVLECHRLGLTLLPPSVNEPGPAFVAHGRQIRVPLTRLKGLTQRTSDRLLAAHGRGPFTSPADFFHRVAPSGEEFEAMIRVGGLDGFGGTRTRQFWQARHLVRTYGAAADPGQGWLLPPPSPARTAAVPLQEPTPLERLQAETELFGFAISGHPLDLFPDVAWDTYCPVSRLAEHAGQTVTTCGLVVEQRTHHQATGEPMKFLSLADHTGIVEIELFAPTYRSHGLATVRYPVLEVEGRVEPFENGRGFTLRVLRAGKPRSRPEDPKANRP
ncbi:MAG TPA: fused DNA polymerase IV/DNA polymerase III subunit alpha, partial [Verrucomicrobiota bacterium]|nr:fused DNA polymerase IV/DNA polymerase III subunit alpha [Verrucomicrobiota bacterium]